MKRGSFALRLGAGLLVLALALPTGVWAADPQAGGWACQAMAASAAREQGLDGTGVRVAVIDTGVDADYDFGADTLAPGWNYMTNTANTADTVGHGTAVCSLIAGLPGNGVGADGLAPGATLVPLVFYGLDEAGRMTGGTLELAARAIRDAVEVYDCQVISMSWGITRGNMTPDEEALLTQACALAAKKGALLLAAVGNDGSDTHLYPAALDTVVGVGALGLDARVWAGSQTSGDAWIVVPGEQVFPGYRQSGTGGTSFAAPLAAAVAAILLQAKPDMTAPDLKALLAAAALDLGEPGWDAASGWGRLRLEPVLAALRKGTLWAAEEDGSLLVWSAAGTVTVQCRDDRFRRISAQTWEAKAPGGVQITLPPTAATVWVFLIDTEGMPTAFFVEP